VSSEDNYRLLPRMLRNRGSLRSSVCGEQLKSDPDASIARAQDGSTPAVAWRGDGTAGGCAWFQAWPFPALLAYGGGATARQAVQAARASTLYLSLDPRRFPRPLCAPKKPLAQGGFEMDATIETASIS